MNSHKILKEIKVF